jgi:hypothetical protein
MTNTHIIGIGVVGVSSADAIALTKGNTEVSFGSASRTTATGNITSNASATNRAHAKAGGGSGGVVGSGILNSDATVDSATRAFLAEGAQILQAGNVSLIATAINQSSAETPVGTGGFVSSRGAQATANVTPHIEAFIDNNASMQNINGSITVRADSVRAEGDANSTSYGGGFVDVGAANSDTRVEPTVNAFVDTGANIHATEA